MKKQILLLSASIITGLLINFVVIKPTKSYEKSRIGILGIMNASAGEAYCKDSSDKPCIIESGGIKVSGIGQPYINQ